MFDLLIYLTEEGTLAEGKRNPDGTVECQYFVEGFAHNRVIEADEYELRGLLEQV